MSLRSSKVNCHRLKLIIHIKILVLAVLLLKDQEKAIYNLLPPNRRPNKESKQHDGSVS